MRWLGFLLISFCLNGFAATLTPIKIAENVYAFIGDTDEVSLANRGRIGNAGFIVAPEGIVVVNTGISFRHAKAMVRAIKGISKRPIRLAIITHAHQEFLMGASYFQRHGVPILAHVKTAELMQSRCENCLHHLKKSLGNKEMHGTKVVVPDQYISASEFISVAGASIEIHALGWGNTPGDIAVFHRESGVLFAGGLVDERRVPELRDSRIKEWQLILDRLQGFSIKRIVPGHGGIGDADTISQFAAYLKAIEAKARDLYAENVSLSDAERLGGLPQFSDWVLYKEQHHKNVHRAYLQVEQEDLAQ